MEVEKECLLIKSLDSEAFMMLVGKTSRRTEIVERVTNERCPFRGKCGDANVDNRLFGRRITCPAARLAVDCEFNQYEYLSYITYIVGSEFFGEGNVMINGNSGRAILRVSVTEGEVEINLD